MYTIVRVNGKGGEHGSFGVFLENNIPFLVTLERPWLDNKTDISCIPDGHYSCKRVNSHTFGNTFEVCNVCGRDQILFHAGNFVYDSRGCILLGKSFEIIGGKFGISNSKNAFAEFLKRLDGKDKFDLNICVGGL